MGEAASKSAKCVGLRPVEIKRNTKSTKPAQVVLEACSSRRERRRALAELARGVTPAAQCDDARS